MIRVEHGDRLVEVSGTAGDTVLEALAAEAAVSMAAPCGGRGKCGKCRVRVLDPPGGPEPSAECERFLSGDEIRAGIRLACRCPAAAVRRIEILTDYTRASVKGELPAFAEAASPPPEVARAGGLSAAVDIGTTTIAAFLLDAATGEPLAVQSQMNRQSLYGADVLSRISYAEGGGLERLSSVVRAQLQAMLSDLCDRVGHRAAEVGTLVVAGNTTMLHLLAGADPGGIGRAPFVPQFVDMQDYAARDLGIQLADAARLIMLPSVSAYVGADLVADAIAADLDRSAGAILLVDIGTNGELILRHGGRQWACSTAAGPAFEGGTLEAGVGGINGAVKTWNRRGSEFRFTTIGGAEPVGVCGSGLLELLATLLDDEVIDQTGRMRSAEELGAAGTGAPGTAAAGTAAAGNAAADGTARAYAGRLTAGPRGEPAFLFAPPYMLTQKDVREVQLAKAAIAAGIDVLCREAGLTTADLDTVVLTGGFGQHLDVESAIRIGILPPVEPERVDVLENGAGRGTVLALRQDGTMERMIRFREAVTYIELSGHDYFGDRYIEHMTFPENRTAAIRGGNE